MDSPKSPSASDTPAAASASGPDKKALVLNILALLCGLWFLLVGMNWWFAAALILGYPVAIVGFIFWYVARKTAPASRLNRVALGILVLGLVLSIASLLMTK